MVIKHRKKNGIPKHNPGNHGLTQHEHDGLMKLVSVMSKTDADAVPMVYFPRSAIKVLEDIRDDIVEQNIKLNSLLQRRD